MDSARERTPHPDPTHQSSTLDSHAARAQPTIHIVTQDECFKHVFRRTKERSTIYERPERLRFVNLGLAAALAWDSLHNLSPARLLAPATSNEPSIATPLVLTPLVTFTKTTRKLSTLDPAFAQIHDQPNRPSSPEPASSSNSQAHPDRFASFHASNSYLEQLVGLCLQASELNLLGLSEVPQHLPQGDLYLSPGSEAAILGSIGACYTAIDSVLKPEPKKDEAEQSPKYKKAFVNIRPPGHHCTNSEPMGFCWVNNVLIGCMYSYLTYDIDRICIVDIDLHHGNGSQEIVWRINEQVALQPESSGKRRLMISYSSLHDINSYPCEDGDPVRIKDASLNICVGNAINQFIQNLHLQDWVDESDFFDRLYPKTWQAFEQHMSAFFRISDADPDHSLIFVSAGFDACEHESEDMSRYAKKLPTSFFNRFARDISRFSEAHCHGRLISVLEGGYSERALTGSSLSYMLGLMGRETGEETVGPAWGAGRLERLIRLCKRTESVRRGQTKGLEEPDVDELAWLTETRRIFEAVDGFGQAQNELKTVARREQKQRLLQQNLGLLDARSPDGPRRSQRHASGSKPSPAKPDPHPRHPSAPSKTLPTSPAMDPPRPAAPPSPSSDHSSPLTSEPESSTDEPPVISTTAPGSSIDNLFSNLQLGPDVRPPSSPPPHPVSSSSSSTTAAAQQQPQQQLPKLKLVWKAGGVLGTSQNNNQSTTQSGPSDGQK
ncbi:hypothetical protein PGT21_027884 [Puccinia graminis f. sp. tritici]|uniref:Histone deacetylase domain-containing protein n=1 Tax=Puccinia graminis f. sp. tritici TaxID=56615 RepID=A0A5B0P5G9_PUCGR|nr:hypothetical protein PGT21_027884 [Puccinia graminis f. sp. tritici]KAA1108104.1 hypothetical protein PGTUg99_030623 [Puccinia graminis f. sp. tritici]